MLPIPLPLCEDFLYPSHLTIGQPYLDAIRMMGRFGQNILYNAPGQSPAALVFFQHDIDFNAGFYITQISTTHWIDPSLPQCCSVWPLSGFI